MTLAKRIRDCRYIKGWGPDELASRASISRTALYQIESGKTELPRAATLRRLARALDVPMEILLGHSEPTSQEVISMGVGTQPGPGRDQPWAISDGATIAPFARHDVPNGGAHPEDGREKSLPVASYLRPSISRGDLSKKFHDLLDSRMSEQVIRFIEEAHRSMQPAHVQQAD